MAVPKWSVDDNKLWFNSGLWQEGVPKHPDFPVISLGDWFDQKTDEFAKNNVIWFLKTFMKYGVLRKYTDSFATSLAKQGIKKGDVVAILLPNSFQFTISYFAIVHDIFKLNLFTNNNLYQIMNYLRRCYRRDWANRKKEYQGNKYHNFQLKYTISDKGLKELD